MKIISVWIVETMLIYLIIQIVLMLYLYEKKSIYGCAVGIKIFVDGILIGKVKNNSSLSIMLPIGIHNVKFDVWSGCTDYNITIPQGYRTVYLEFGIKMGLLTNELEILSCRYE